MLSTGRHKIVINQVSKVQKKQEHQLSKNSNLNKKENPQKQKRTNNQNSKIHENKLKNQKPLR